MGQAFWAGLPLQVRATVPVWQPGWLLPPLLFPARACRWDRGELCMAGCSPYTCAAS